MEAGKIKVVYNIGGNPDTLGINTGLHSGLDTRIIEFMESLGGKWYAQGMNTETGDRDICFDLPKVVNKKGGE